MRAKKSLGQHFLKSERALSKIVEAANLKVGETVLEIGPGTGALTKKLLEAGVKVVAVEKDDELSKLLKQEFEKEIGEGKLELIQGDILESDLSKIVPSNYKLVANIPYNITGAIFKKFLGERKQPETMVLLVQKEVAKRIVATLLTPSVNRGKESILSISVKVYGEPRYVETVKAGSFAPAPKVDSAIIAIENISKEFFASASRLTPSVNGRKWISEKDFFLMLRAGFKSKRKKLSSNLSTVFEKSVILEAFRKLGLDENIRAEDVGLETWRKISSYLIET